MPYGPVCFRWKNKGLRPSLVRLDLASLVSSGLVWVQDWVLKAMRVGHVSDCRHSTLRRKVMRRDRTLLHRILLAVEALPSGGPHVLTMDGENRKISSIISIRPSSKS